MVSTRLLFRISIALAIAMPTQLAAAQTRRSEAPSELDGELPNPVAVVHFPTGSTRLDARDRRALALAVAWLDEHPAQLLIIEGHADPEGAAAANLSLSQRRADVVHDELVRLGGDPRRMVGAAYGETEPTGDRGASRRVVVRGTVLPFTELIEEQYPPDIDELEEPDLEEPELEERTGAD